MEHHETLPRSDDSACSPTAPTLEDKVHFLSHPATHSCAPNQMLTRETHMSWVFMAGQSVYKLKKPVRFSFLDFSTLDRREAACRAEFLLNRRLAPYVYLDVVPLTVSTSGLAIHGEGLVVDWLVVPRRLDEKQTLEAALAGTWLKASHVDRVASTLCSFYAHAPRVQLDPERYVFEWQRAIADNTRVLLNSRFSLPQGCMERITQVQRRFITKRSNLLRERIRERWYVDAQLRALDPLDEIAFLHLECERLGGAWAGERIRRHLASALNEDTAGGLFLFYRSYRAILRARLSIAHLLAPKPLTPEKWPRHARLYLKLAAADATR